jgi:hypothetical protein
LLPSGPVLYHALSGPFKDLWVTESDTFSLKSTWVTLPPDFGSTTAGLALAFPPSNTTTGRFLGCSVDARWARGSNWAESTLDNIWLWERGTILAPTQSVPAHRRAFNFLNGIYVHLFLPANDSTWTPISASLEYLQGMTPPFSNTSSLTTLEKILIDSIPRLFSTDYNFLNNTGNLTTNFIPFVEHVISTMAADAIARTGSSLQRPAYNIYGGPMSHPFENGFCNASSATGVSTSSIADNLGLDLSAPSTPMIMETYVIGYAYLISGFGMYVAAGILLLHMGIALLDVFWILGTRRTSTAWDKITELLVLAQNSPPTEAFVNTAGGIRKKRTFQAVGKIEQPPGSENEVQLVWNCDSALAVTIKPGQMY